MPGCRAIHVVWCAAHGSKDVKEDAKEGPIQGARGGKQWVMSLLRHGQVCANGVGAR